MVSWSLVLCFLCFLFFFFKQKTAYEMRISDWSSDVCSSDLQRALAVAHFDMHSGQVLAAVGGVRADLIQQPVADGEFGVDRAAPGADEFYVGRLVPDDVVAPEILHQHQHEERVDHRIQRAAELRTDIIAVVPAQHHLDLNQAHIRADVPHPNTGSDVWRVEIHGPAQKPRLARQTGGAHAESFWLPRSEGRWVGNGLSSTVMLRGWPEH